MRCQLCNAITEDYQLNKKTGERESICEKCREIVDATVAELEERDPFNTNNTWERSDYG